MAMYLSILIPTYNYVCTTLVEALVQQAQAIEGLRYEIIVGDDGSTQASVLVANRAINAMSGAVYWETNTNSGRAAIRNKLYECSKGRWLLFLDSDGLPLSDAFLSQYLAAVAKISSGVVCGGVAHPSVLPSPDVSLRWLHETTFERRTPIEWRNEHPYTNFRSFNFIIDRESFSKVLFDEDVKFYGYEDNLFGRALQEKSIAVSYINNPMLNADIENNALYLAKNEEALRTLSLHYDTMGPTVRLSQTLAKIERFHAGWLLSFVYKLARRLLVANLKGPSPRMWVFNLYRAGYLRALLRGQAK